MVYFVSHVVLKHGAWLPLSAVPVSLVNLKDDSSPRSLSGFSHSVQLVFQPGRLIKPLSGSVVKTHFIKEFQRRYRARVEARRRLGLPKNIMAREIGLPPTGLRAS